MDYLRRSILENSLECLPAKYSSCYIEDLYQRKIPRDDCTIIDKIYFISYNNDRQTELMKYFLFVHAIESRCLYVTK